jgi:hypothetical protein
MKSNALKAWEIDTAPAMVTQICQIIREDAAIDAAAYLESAKVDLGGE